MKKTNVHLIIMLVCMLGIITVSCMKEKDNEAPSPALKKQRNATAIKLNANYLKIYTGFSGNYILSARAGHNGSNCNGCVMAGGVKKHLNCQGWGSSCELKASVVVSRLFPDDPNSTQYFAKGLYDYEPTDEADFNMPARSFYIEDTIYESGHIWINIPSQLLERNAESNLFLFYNISFSDEALFENL